jgi:hypothetical protein
MTAPGAPWTPEEDGPVSGALARAGKLQSVLNGL